MAALLIRSGQRRVIRRAVRIPCQAVDDAAWRLLGDRALDLSAEGMLIESEADVPLGTDVLVSFRSPRGTSWLDAEAEVARVIDGRRRGDYGRCLGLRFKYMETIDRVLLRAKLEGLPPPIPQRRLRVDYAATIRRIAAFDAAR